MTDRDEVIHMTEKPKEVAQRIADDLNAAGIDAVVRSSELDCDCWGVDPESVAEANYD